MTTPTRSTEVPAQGNLLQKVQRTIGEGLTTKPFFYQKCIDAGFPDNS